VPIAVSAVVGEIAPPLRRGRRKGCAWARDGRGELIAAKAGIEW